MGKYRFIAKFSYSPSRQVIRITVPREVSKAIIDELKKRGVRTRTILVEVEI